MKKLIQRYKQLNPAARASIWFVFCNLMQKGISTITVPIFTRLLTTEEYGTYSLYLSWFNILTVVTSLNLYYGVFNNLMNRESDPKVRDQYVSSMQGIVVTLTAVLAVIYLPFQDFWSSALGLSRLAIWLMLLELLVEPSVQFYLARQRFEFKYKHAVSITMLKSILNPVLGLALVLLADEDRATVRIISVVITEVLVSGTIMILQFAKGRVFFSESNWKYALSFNIPLIPHYLSAVLLNQADRVMIRMFDSVSKVGIYSVAYNIGMLMQLFTNAINSSLTPWTYDKMNKGDYRSIRKSTTTLLLLLASAILCMLLFVPELVKIFATAEYYEAIYVVPPVACSVYFIFLYNIFAIPQMYYERQKFMSVASVAAAGLNIILNYVFINLFGFLAAGYTTVACYLCYSVGHYIFCRKVCMEEIGSMELYNTKAILGISMGVLSCSVVFNVLYAFSYIRYTLIVVAVIIVIMKRKAILNNL
ncbi:MAG: oligosaccharide flippase family protein [Lachnospiraceae bacterium]|nr:oligosaccharide flippase family protein [Lachnospiraceae bacterium]